MSSDRTRVLMEKFCRRRKWLFEGKVFDNPKKNKQLAGILPLKILRRYYY